MAAVSDGELKGEGTTVAVHLPLDRVVRPISVAAA